MNIIFKSFIFFLLLMTEVQASRTLMIPMFRTRYDVFWPAYLSANNLGANNIVYRSFRGNQMETIVNILGDLNRVQLRLRLELQNISDKNQKLHLYVRNESHAGISIGSGNRMSIGSGDLDGTKPHLGKKINSTTLGPYDKQTVFLDNTCINMQTGTATCAWTINTSTDVKSSITVDTTNIANLSQFFLDQSIGLSIEIEEDIGAVTGAISSILNITNGFPYQGNPISNLIFNGGKPF